MCADSAPQAYLSMEETTARFAWSFGGGSQETSDTCSGDAAGVWELQSPAMPMDLNDHAAVIDLLEEAAVLLRSHPNRRGCCVNLPARGRLVLTGDLHDNVIHLKKVLSLAKLDQDPEHHVILHELIHGERLINGLDFSHRMICRVAELVREAPLQVHPLLANHEMAQLTGKGVSKGAGNATELFLEAIDYVYGDDGPDVAEAVNTFFKAMPLALRSEHGVFCAHSLPNNRLMGSFDRDVLERELVDEDYLGPTGAAYSMCWGRVHTDEQLAELAESWGVRMFCLGHQKVETGIEQRHPNAITLNSDHDRGVALPVRLDALPSPEEALINAIPLNAI